jgi:hypothetical protein
MGKWNRFREARAKVVDTYIEVKRTQLLNRLVIANVTALGILKKLDASCSRLKALRKQKNQCIWLVVSLKGYWKQNMRHFRGLEGMFRQRIRYSFAISGSLAHSDVEGRAKHIVFQFLVYQYGLNMFVKKLKLLMWRLTFIQ